ncbi:HisA/HisF-related TIM barrel protein [Methanofollis fontis]|nr:HisA/HisF-related TIM barrel protein [Methanofollis fontis]
MDLKSGFVVHGAKGKRETYAPLDWGLAGSAEPIAYVEEMRPRNIYIADLDRIEGVGDHDDQIRRIAAITERCYVDRGCRSPADLLDDVVNVIGTETAGDDLAGYGGCFLSIDVMDGRVIPSGRTPRDVLEEADALPFAGCILLHISGVGTGCGLPDDLEDLRSAYSGRLFWGGGVAGVRHLDMLEGAGFDGAIVATGVHRGTIPLEWVREGRTC